MPKRKEPKPDLTEIRVNHVYRAKNPKPVAAFPDNLFNDRMVVHIGPFDIQYDSSTVKNGRHYPTVSKGEFVKWAGEDVTEGYPAGDWAPWEKE